MIAKILILALAAAVNCQYYSSYGGYGGYGGYGSGYGSGGYYGAGLGGSYGVPVYKHSALYGGLAGANGWGYGANLGRVAGLGALRTTGAIVGSGALGYGSGALIANQGLGVANLGVANLGVANLGVAHGHGLGLGLNVARGVSVHQAGPVNAAVHTISRTVDYKPVPYSGEPAVVQDIDVPPQESPLRINFQSKSSPLALTQQHIPAEPGQVQVTHSEDEPHTAIHNVDRSVIQQVNEVIKPYRVLTQTIDPVIEQTHTNIAQGEGVRLTGLTSGIVGGSGVLGASGLGVATGVAAPVGVGIAGYGAGYGLRTANLGGLVGLGGVRTLGLNQGLIGNAGLIGNSGIYGAGYYGNAGLVGARGLGLGYGVGQGIGHGYYGSGIRTIGTGYGHGYGAGYGGLALNGLSGLSGYGTTAKIARF